MSVARNVWRPAADPHIVPTAAPDQEVVERLIASCPAGLFHERRTAACRSTTGDAWSAAPAGYYAMRQRSKNGAILTLDLVLHSVLANKTTLNNSGCRRASAFAA